MWHLVNMEVMLVTEPTFHCERSPLKDVALIRTWHHAGNRTHVPLREVAVEGRGTLEHVIHVGNRTHVPLREVAVEGCGFSEHGTHVGNRTHVPLREVAVEGCGAKEQRTSHPTARGRRCRMWLHRTCPGNRTHVPLREVAVEGCGNPKHVIHVGNRTHVPLREVAVEGCGLLGTCNSMSVTELTSHCERSPLKDE